MIYVAGSLRNPNMLDIRDRLTDALPEHQVFMDWYAAGPEADDHWKAYYQSKGLDYLSALKEPASVNVYNFDKKFIDQSDYMVLVLPAGKSGHMELGYQIGRGKHGIILLDGSSSEERWDIMYQFASLVTYDLKEVMKYIMEHDLASNS
jgi:nucleoside 2-deoxyribosyltransferase